MVRGPECHSPGCRGYGNTDKGVMIIGIAPGRDEVRTGRPFTGPSGQVLDAILQSVGIPRKDIYCTNMICWWKDDPSKEEALKCRDRLLREIAEIKPKLIIYAGKIVAEIMTGRSFGKVRGAVQWSTEFNCYTMATFHPAAILRGASERTSSKDDKAAAMVYDFVRDLRKIDEVITWEPKAPQSIVKYEVVDDPVYAQNILHTLKKNEEVAALLGQPVSKIALDVETTYDKDDEEVDVFENDVLCVGIGDKNYAWVFTPKALFKEDKTTPALEWPDLHWVMHNAIFDTQVMHKYLGVWIKVKEDTMLQSYSLDERAGVHRLKTLSREYLAAGFYEDDRFYGKMKLDEIPRELLYEYNAKDVVYTARLCERFTQQQIEDEVREHYLRILIPAINMYKEIQYRGINIDRALHAKFAWEWGHKYLEDEEELMDIAEQAGYPGRININSSPQMRKLLFGYLSLPVVKRTPKGEPSTDKDVLEALQGQHEFVDKLLDFRHLAHMYGLYILNLNTNLKDDGRVHPIIKLHSSVNGRPSFTDPPMQTIPRYSEEFAETYSLLRNMFKISDIEWVRNFNIAQNMYVPEPDDEMVMIEVDYGKAELWTAAYVSNDQQMFADLKSGDYHTNVAADVKDKPVEEVTKDDRNTAKRVSFGTLYDIEGPSLSKQIKSTVPQAIEYIQRFRNRNRDYAAWAKETQKLIRTKGELRIVSGRKRRIIIVKSAVRALKQAVNFPVQATANDVLLDAAIEIHPKLKEIGGHILLTVHDSIISEVPRSRAKEAFFIIHDAMTAERFKGMVRLPVEVKMGYNWGQNIEVHDCAIDADKQKPNKYGIPQFGRCTY